MHLLARMVAVFFNLMPAHGERVIEAWEHVYSIYTTQMCAMHTGHASKTSLW